jgi:carboxyl-terminal processing protease
VTTAIDMVSDKYVKVTNPGDLAVGAVKGVYRRLEEPVPSEIEAKFKNAKELTSPERRQLLVDSRLKLGKREDLENNKDADIGITMMLASLNDPYTTYFDKEQIKKTASQLRGEFRGVGIQIRRDLVKDALLVVSPIKGSPAYLAGIQAGDHIVGIKRESNPEGEPLKADEKTEFSTAGMKTEQAIEIILGKVGIPITLVIERNGEKKEVKLKRGRVSVETVLGVKRDEKDNWDFWLDPEKKIAYIQLTQFAPQTTLELANLLRKLDEQGIKGLVLDLRFNPGGVLNGAATICSMFVEDGKVVTVRPRVGREESLTTRTFSAPQTYTKYPIAVLINGSSASASEIVSACLQDYGRAIIVGERSYGKGSVQQLQEFRSTEGEIKMTTARYFPPSDKNIDKISADPAKPDEWGVKPDKGFEVKLSKEAFRELFDHFRDREIIPAKDKPAKPDPEKPAKEFKDVQLDKAIEYVRDQLKAGASK